MNRAEVASNDIETVNLAPLKVLLGCLPVTSYTAIQAAAKAFAVATKGVDRQMAGIIETARGYVPSASAAPRSRDTNLTGLTGDQLIAKMGDLV
ncbi:hypothetical protein [Kutzneria buriramensis]|uniref:hypothetical protein n=1 Tax=Kutzneria buriramensis TaxID=1045776 RepID=UPI0011C17DDB|nr:hypothetical protein [Kutzneria buriramensis]